MKNILKLALPLTLSQLIAMALVLTDVWMMSHISVADLAAGGLGASVYSFVFLIAGSVVGCVANLIAIAYGQSIARPRFGRQQIRFAVKGAAMLSVLLTLILTVGFSFAPELLIKAKQSPEVIEIAMRYLNALKWAMLPTLLLLVLRGLTSTFGDVRSVMMMSIITVLINVPISYVLAFPLNLGIAGLGYGTTLSAWIVLLGYGNWVFRQRKYLRFSPWKNLQEFSPKLMLPLLSMGMPIALASMLEHGLIYGGTLLAGMIGIASLALHQILLQCLSFTWNINFGFAQASAILVGKEFGSGNFAEIKVIAKKSFLAVTALSVFVASGFAVWPELIAKLFQLDSQGHQLTELLVSVIWIVALCFIVDAWQLLAINLLRGMKIVMMPTMLTAIGYWLFGLPAAWWLMKSYGLAGIWGGIGIGLGVTGVLLLGQLIYETKRVAYQELAPTA
ncbi:MATE family efflux transporter [Vibrio sp. UCD-FRSSP16_10]|uniref:MATE family efflux transporter n=1 Tax=unclassified Vibrio TaxID=2614977 RepID=UPI0007FF1E8E|nr:MULTISPECIES: MATE family efflux transporter [unclassified Vibrio]OBT08568.1 MATE family efflux transporter [Vibrio sp. UCD-FRSSP16_30]OBT18098.1 MATE family efflux transporter [Vibrio sp. UCD-FRSSP16_10]